MRPDEKTFGWPECGQGAGKMDVLQHQKILGIWKVNADFTAIFSVISISDNNKNASNK